MSTEKAMRVDWGGSSHGLSLHQMHFARRILHAVHEEMLCVPALMDLDGRITEPEGLARFEQTLVEALQVYDTYRTERIKELETLLKEFIEKTAQPMTVGDPIGDRKPIFPRNSVYYGAGGEPIPIAPDFVAGPRFPKVEEPSPREDEGS